MNFKKALEALYRGKKVRAAHWAKSLYAHEKSRTLYLHMEDGRDEPLPAVTLLNSYDSEWMEYVEEIYYKDLKPGQRFLLTVGNSDFVLVKIKENGFTNRTVCLEHKTHHLLSIDPNSRVFPEESK